MPPRRRRDRRARCRRPTTPMAANSGCRAARRRRRANGRRGGQGSASALGPRRPFQPAPARLRAPPHTTTPPRCGGPRPEPCRRQIRCRKAPARRRSGSWSSARVSSAAGVDRPLSSPGPMTSCLIDGALVLSDSGFAAGTVLVEGRHIAAVSWYEAEREALRARAGTVVAAQGHWLIPGLLDGHSHAYAALLRGTQNSLPLELWAFYTVLYGRAFDAAALRSAILLGAAERIRSGITGWIDHSPMTHLGEAALAAHEASGLRVGYAPFLHDVADDALLGMAVPAPVARLADGAPALDPPRYASQFDALVETARAGSGRVSVLLGPNAPQRCSPAAWELWRSLRERHGVYVHIHLMETRAQAVIGARSWPGGLVAEMARQGLLGEWLSVAHG